MVFSSCHPERSREAAESKDLRKNAEHPRCDRGYGINPNGGHSPPLKVMFRMIQSCTYSAPSAGSTKRMD